MGDFSAKESGLADKKGCTLAVLKHAVQKADQMLVPLSVTHRFAQALKVVLESLGSDGLVEIVEEALVLRPSSGVLEASDYLSEKHDWVQLEEEVTEALPRALYIPAGFAAKVTKE